MIETILSGTFLVALVIGLIVGFAIGCWWYRSTLAKDPAKIAKLAAEANAAGAKVGDVFHK